MKSICFFNNKGGVGKTTLVANVAAFLATMRERRVLVVDADPQCNATQLILGDRYVTKLYGRKSRASTSRKPMPPLTLYDILRPIAIGDSSITEPAMAQAKENRFGVDLLPGDPRVALLEDKLSQAWLELSGGDIGGARQTNWNGQLISHIEESYDFIFYDVGPSLGALNRSVLLGADYFV
ncbi:MAG: ParA family protein, partial [Rhodopirellula sp. JB053]